MLGILVAANACGDSAGGDLDATAIVDATQAVDAESFRDATSAADAMPPVPQFTELWYSADQQLVRVVLDVDNGSVVEFVSSALLDPLPVGQNLLTMLADGSLLGARLSNADHKTYFYHIATPPRDGSPVALALLGVMPENLMLEGLYTDCDGRVYAMDTGSDSSNSAGNRLLRFTGNPLVSDYAYVIVTDLSSATVADIDDMGPAIIDGEIVDNPGLAIDSGSIHDFNFETGTGTLVGHGGDYGIHALGGELFTDGRARLYIFGADATLYEMDPTTHALSDPIGTGPAVTSGFAGWSGITGPLTTCDSGFIVD